MVFESHVLNILEKHWEYDESNFKIAFFLSETANSIAND